jgi:hypothetical protein
LPHVEGLAVSLPCFVRRRFVRGMGLALPHVKLGGLLLLLVNAVVSAAQSSPQAPLPQHSVALLSDQVLLTLYREAVMKQTNCGGVSPSTARPEASRFLIFPCRQMFYESLHYVSGSDGNATQRLYDEPAPLLVHKAVIPETPAPTASPDEQKQQGEASCPD